MNPNQLPKATVQYDKTSLFIGYTSLPLKGDSRDFYKENIEDLFTDYKKKIKYFHEQLFDTTDSAIEQFEDLYNPQGYFLFGEFDLAVIALIDDFSFATKKFRPHKESFKYQVNTGLIPVFRKDGQPIEGDTFDVRHLFSKDVFAGNALLPLVAITSIKLNSGLLVGNGKQFTDAVCCYLKHFLDTKKQCIEGRGPAAGNPDAFRYEFLLIESLGWNEITLISFSNSFGLVQEVVQALRNNNWRDVKDFLCSDEYKYAAVDIPLLEEASLLNEWIAQEATEQQDGQKKDSDCAHPFIATNTQYGYHINYGEKDVLPVLDKEYDVTNTIGGQVLANWLEITWNVKAGHDAAFISAARKYFMGTPGLLQDGASFTNSEYINSKADGALDRFLYVAGKNSVQYPSEPITFKTYIEKIHNGLLNNNGFTELSRHVYKVQSYITRSVSVASFIKKEDAFEANRNNCGGEAFDVRDSLDQLVFNGKDIDVLDDRLREINISKVLKGQVINMYYNFNEAIKDQLIFNNFIDLRESLVYFGSRYVHNFDKQWLTKNDFSDWEDNAVIAQGIQEAKAGYGQNGHIALPAFQTEKTEKNTQWIYDFVESWDIAFWNRYFHSYYFTEVSDFNLEHHGGIEMILSAYDSMYKIICEAIYGQFKSDYKPYPFVRVTIEPCITSNAYSNQLNFIHLFLPSLYAATVVHEASNQVLFMLKHLIEPTVHGVQASQFLNFITLLRNGMADNEAAQANPFLGFGRRVQERYLYQSDTEKKIAEEYLGANFIRYLITDYFTYQLQYAYTGDTQNGKEQEKLTAIGIDKFIGFHLGCFAQQTELYRLPSVNGQNWEFDTYHFKANYVRLLIMLHFFEKKDYHKQFAPFSVFEPLYTSHAHEVRKLAAEVSKELETLFDDFDIRGLLRQLVTQIRNSSKVDNDGCFDKIIRLNQDFMDNAYGSFYYNNPQQQKQSAYKTSVLVRSNINMEQDNIAGSKSNIVLKRADTHETIDYNPLVLDPKGGIFTIDISKRGDIHAQNCQYMKDVWDIAQRWRKKMYKVPLGEKEGQA